MKSLTKLVLATLHVIAWIVFLGLCVKTGAILYSFFVSLAINHEGAKNIYMGLNLSGLYNFDSGHYITVALFVIVLSGLKAYLFYLAVTIFLKINMVNPFSEDVSLLISRIGYLSLGIGILAVIANKYCDWLIKKGVAFPDMQSVLGGCRRIFAFRWIIFIIAQVFKRGNPN
jgi:hypothetical protein